MAYDGRPVMKLSTDKATTPGAKQVFRGGEGDVLALREEATPSETEPLLEPVMRGGARLGPAESLETLRNRCEADLAALPEAARRLRHPTPPAVQLSAALQELTTAVELDLARRRETV